MNSSIDAQGLPVAKPGAVGMSSAKLEQIDELVNADIAAKKLPGAVVLVGHRGKIVFRKAYGNRSLVPTVERMTVDTIFDVASLTKPVATATSIMILVERGQLRLNDTVGKFMPEIEDEQAKRVTILQLLTHTSGYAPDFDLSEKWTGREGMLAALKKEKLKSPPGTKFVYSDIGFIVLGEIVRTIAVSARGSGTFLTDKFANQWFADEEIFYPLKLSKSGFLQNVKLINDKARWVIAPTENIHGQRSYLGSKFDGDKAVGDEILRGQVHDPTAFRMGGVAGHAGLFSTADDLARYCQMILNGGAVPDWRGGHPARPLRASKMLAPPVRVLSASTVARMTQPYVVSETGETRGLGWDINTSFSSNRGELFPLGSFGHTGFTGTGLWIDPTSQTFVVFLSNRVHPDGKGDVVPLRAKISTVVASAIEDTPIEKWKEAEARYNAAVAAQLLRRTAGSLPAGNVNNTQAGSLRSDAVRNGIDVLERDGFKQFENLKIGLVTNHTGRNLAGKLTIDILREAKNVKLTTIFAPEHGIRGEVDDKVGDTKDEKTGLPVYSLYGETRRPKAEQTAEIDAFVYDIQDIGTRFYTYASTLRNVMEEAAKGGKPVFVLDRPNPINGLSVEGSVADDDKLSFIAAHTTPVRHGMTIGELAMMINGERKIGADVRVIKMDGWNRAMWFDETGQTWINTSPNMRSLTEATLYPGIGLLETTNLSVGRGTDTPFEVIGAPWLDGQKLASYLNGRRLKGVRFVPIRFKPTASVFKNEQLGGVNIIITNRSEFNAVRVGLEIACALRKLYPNDWQVEKYSGLLVNAEVLDMIMQGASPDEIDKATRAKLNQFLVRRAKFLLY
ncbi:MAG: DUF1343 domain-containing protein [Pyrinomonadaceae bacterium]|nr:DUF1343 domain-containing protein [Pyrinomonadaceae bacterium]